ncbi:putative sister chromatid cohesion protein Mis4 [Fonsecaea pedrosoi]|nr:putative sister chromatid cohesion protein Mis4 [Fonsecaea pedrosoi]
MDMTGDTIKVVVPRRRQNDSNDRQLSVDQAFQYTPMTMPILQPNECVPFPQVACSNDSRLTSPSERQAVYRSELDTPATRERLAVLLDPRRLSEIKFPRAPVQNDNSIRAELNSIPKMVLKMSKIDYTYKSSTTGTPPAARKKTLQMPITKPASIIIDIPKPPPSFRKEDYVNIQDTPKRQNEPPPPTKPVLATTSKKQKDDQLLASFESQLGEIFEIRDQIDLNNSAERQGSPNGIFDLPDDEDDTEPRLAIRLQEKLQSTLNQLLTSGRLCDVSPEYLQRLQKICEPVIERAQAINLQVPPGGSDEDTSTWLSKLHTAESGAASACTLIYTVLGAPQNQDLLNLEALQWLPNVLVNLFENCLIPIVEARPDGQNSELFSYASAHHEPLKRLLDVGRKLLDLVARMCVEIKGAGSLVNATEFLAAKLIFVQNAYNDKASALGSQAYERLRKQAMAALARLYAAFPSERRAILDEVLTSLDKLPSNSRSARQYKLAPGKNIQLVSALFMQLVQTSAMQTGMKRSRKSRRGPRKESQASDSSDQSEDSASDMEVDSVSTTQEIEKRPLSRLGEMAQSLFHDASSSAHQIVMWMIDKASKVTKTGDSPYRNILDLFVEDLTLVLPLPDWPASELLLTALALRMKSLAETDKSASTKNMALESLGVMGSAISQIRASARSSLSAFTGEGESHTTTIARDLSDSVKERPHFLLDAHELVSARGPFSIVYSYLSQRGGEGLRTKSAQAFFLVKFGGLIYQASTQPQDKERDFELDSTLERTVSAILQQLSGSVKYNEIANDHTKVTEHEAQLAYMLSILNGRFCRMFLEIATTLSSSIASDQAQVRTRSLKSFVAMLEIDSSLLDWGPALVDMVLKCASDDSSMVRDSALTLIARFIMPRPALQKKAFMVLLKCTDDPNVGVQKRAMAHLKDVYLKEGRANVKEAIAVEFLKRTAHQETSVAELAKKILAEIWVDPKLATLSSAAESAHLDVAIEDLKSHIVRCVGNDTARLAPLLKEFLVWKLKDSKHIDQIQHLCARIVKKLLDAANSSESGPAELATLVAFVEARPEAVVPADLTSLKSYLKDLAKQDNIPKFKSVVAIFRLVLPQLSSTQAPLLQEVQKDLLRASPKLVQREVIEEVMWCLRSIDGVLHETVKLARFTISLVRNVLRSETSRGTAPASPEKMEETKRKRMCLRLLGVAGKVFDLEQYREEFRRLFPTYKGDSVAGVIADCIWEHTSRDCPIEIQVRALECLGLVCQAWPGQFNKRHIRETFFQVLDGTSFSKLDKCDVEKMQITVLEVFQELYGKRAAVKEVAKKGESDGEVQALKNIGGDSKTREDDSAIATITNPLVDHLLHIITSETGMKALLAAQTLASIDHQGMTHPKQSTSAFVALETSTEPQVARVARIAHEHLHQQHESVCEREYVNAVFAAFRYQNEVIKNPQGGLVPGYTAKLATAFAIISTSGSKYVKKFISNLISKLNTEYSKLDVAGDEIPEHLLFVLFVTQNLAFFEYKKMDELLHTVLQLELAFGRNGGETAQAIESHLGPTPVKHAETEGAEVVTPDPAPLVDPAMLRSLTTAACAITLISEARNFLKRQYGLSRDVRGAMQQNKQTKEAGKEPVRVHGITGDKFWHNSNAVLESLNSASAMVARCREFVQLVAIDDEVKIAEEAAMGAMMDVTPDQPPSAQRGRKRKSISGSIGGTPKRARGRPPKNGHAQRSASVSSMENGDDEDF